MIRVLVWSRSAITRAGLEAIVQADGRFEVAASGARSPDLLSAMRSTAAEVVLLDSPEISIMRLPAGSSALPDVPASVVLLDQVRRADIIRILQSGVRVVLHRDSDPEEITVGLEAAHAGLAVFSPEILDALLPLSSDLSSPDELPPGEPLTSRENAVLALLAEGAGNKEIAVRLHISEHTAKFHVSSILNKLGAATRTEAVTRGYKEGLILI